MEPKRNRRKQQRIRMILLTVLVLAALVAAALGLASGKLSRVDSSRGTLSADSGEEAQTAESGAQNSIVYGGRTYVYNDHLSNYLLLGVDTEGSIREKKERGKAGQSDAIFLVSYDRAEETLTGIAIPRDTITQIERFSPEGESRGLSMDHLNLQYANGDGMHESCALTAAAVSRLFNGIPVNGYAALNLDSIPKITELLGGVEVTVPDDALAEKNPDFRKGNRVVLDASNTELFVRTRDIKVSQSAIGRMDRQKVFLEALADTLADRQRKDASTVTKLYSTLEPEMVTNMTNDLFVDLATAERTGGMQTLPGETGHEGAYDVYRVNESELYKMVLDLFYEEAETPQTESK